jgi:hypothetical protein
LCDDGGAFTASIGDDFVFEFKVGGTSGDHSSWSVQAGDTVTIRTSAQHNSGWSVESDEVYSKSININDGTALDKPYGARHDSASTYANWYSSKPSYASWTNGWVYLAEGSGKIYAKDTDGSGQPNLWIGVIPRAFDTNAQDYVDIDGGTVGNLIIEGPVGTDDTATFTKIKTGAFYVDGDSDYLRLENTEIRYGYVAVNFVTDGNSNHTIDSNYIHDNHTSIFSTHVDDTTISNNYIEDTGMIESDCGDRGAMGLMDADNMTITGNTIWNQGYEGSGYCGNNLDVAINLCCNSDGGTVARNYIYGGLRGCIAHDGQDSSSSYDTVIDSNICDNYGAVTDPDFGAAYGVVVNPTGGAKYYSDVTINNNLFTNPAGSGTSATRESAITWKNFSGTAVNVKVHNNIMYLDIQSGDVTSRAIDDNDIYCTGDSNVAIYVPSGDNNYYCGTVVGQDYPSDFNSEVSWAQNNVNDDSLVQTSGGFVVGLDSGSPAIDAGLDLGTGTAIDPNNNDFSSKPPTHSTLDRDANTPWDRGPWEGAYTPSAQSVRGVTIQ